MWRAAASDGPNDASLYFALVLTNHIGLGPGFRVKYIRASPPFPRPAGSRSGARAAAVQSRAGRHELVGRGRGADATNPAPRHLWVLCRCCWGTLGRGNSRGGGAAPAPPRAAAAAAAPLRLRGRPDAAGSGAAVCRGERRHVRAPLWAHTRRSAGAHAGGRGRGTFVLSWFAWEGARAGALISISTLQVDVTLSTLSQCHMSHYPAAGSFTGVLICRREHRAGEQHQRGARAAPGPLGTGFARDAAAAGEAAWEVTVKACQAAWEVKLAFTGRMQCGDGPLLDLMVKKHIEQRVEDIEEKLEILTSRRCHTIT